MGKIMCQGISSFSISKLASSRTFVDWPDKKVHTAFHLEDKSGVSSRKMQAFKSNEGTNLETGLTALKSGWNNFAHFGEAWRDVLWF